VKSTVCFDQAVANGFFISDVTLIRGQHHQLVIAIRHDLEGGGFFVLRATLDASLLDSPIAQLDLALRMTPLSSTPGEFCRHPAGNTATASKKCPWSSPKPLTAPGC
jgi:hypothetical protein